MHQKNNKKQEKKSHHTDYSSSFIELFFEKNFSLLFPVFEKLTAVVNKNHNTSDFRHQELKNTCIERLSVYMAMQTDTGNISITAKVKTLYYELDFRFWKFEKSAFFVFLEKKKKKKKKKIYYLVKNIVFTWRENYVFRNTFLA